MKPIKLVMQGFGPYAGREEVDFRDAIAARLFGIYGPTGSGKSSIFSAITFALFGQAAKNEQAIATLRSDHAAANCPTEVEFLFELRERLYYVRRRPDQERPKASGEGLTKDQHAAWLFDATGLEIDSISQDNCGKPLAEKKVGAVAEEIQKLLGYGAEQFRQIVLLPQGRFEAFLAAKSDERLTILSKLFDVSLYRRIAEKMAIDARQAEQEVVSGRALCGARLRQENCESEDALRGAIRETTERVGLRATELAIAERAKAEASDALSNGKAIEAQFVAHRVASAALTAAERASEGIADLRRRLDLARIAQSLADIDREVTEAKAALALAQKAKAVAHEANEGAKNGLIQAKGVLRLEEARSTGIAALQTQHDELERHANVLKTAKDLEAKALSTEQNLQTSTLALEEIERDFEMLKTEHQEGVEALKVANQDHARRAKLEVRLHSATTLLESAIAHGEASEQAAEAAQQLEVARREAAEATAARIRTQQIHEAAGQALENARAEMLAEGLVDGEPCLVCGSPEHPSPAKGDGDTPELEAKAQDALAELEDKRAAEGKAAVIAAAAEGRSATLTLGLSKLKAPKQTLEALRAETEAINTELADLGPQQDVPEIEARIQTLAGRVASQTEIRNGAQKAVSSVGSDAAVAKNAVELALQNVPQEFRDVSSLTSKKAEIIAEINDRQRALKDAQADEKTAGITANSAEKDFESATNATVKAEAAVTKCSSRFDGRLAKQGLTRESYDVHKADIGKITEFVQTVTEHDHQLEQARGSVRQAELAIKDVERPNLETLLNSHSAADASAKAASEETAKERARLGVLKTLASELAKELARLNRLEEETGPLRALAAAFKGDNSIKTTLESYAIGAMFEQVVAAANLRLVPMTSGQYRFERDSETVSGRSKRGLDIRVHDVHTGRTRDISTLSGGESFIAALALALGLSDVVEMSSGNIRLDTIFIDEGFGSLDTDNDSGTLDRVLQVLQDIVGQNRAVGLISHVPLVQQAIPNGFTIRKTQTGSSIEVRMG